MKISLRMYWPICLAVLIFGSTSASAQRFLVIANFRTDLSTTSTNPIAASQHDPLTFSNDLGKIPRQATGSSMMIACRVAARKNGDPVNNLKAKLKLWVLRVCPGGPSAGRNAAKCEKEIEEKVVGKKTVTIKKGLGNINMPILGGFINQSLLFTADKGAFLVGKVSLQGSKTLTDFRAECFNEVRLGAE